MGCSNLGASDLAGKLAAGLGTSLIEPRGASIRKYVKFVCESSIMSKIDQRSNTEVEFG
jgi:hypothetical protein